MKEYRITVSYYRNIKEWELAHTSYRDEDNHSMHKAKTASGEGTKDTAKRYMENLISNGGKIVKSAIDPYLIGIEHEGKVYTNISVWVDDRNAECYAPYHFYG